ncbi:MAG TPA: hypothetical protein VG347_10775 [Verrucomicrobiae bacterium]|nr:hypothetical protein [Verrucomicrobiae bacterium]
MKFWPVDMVLNQAILGKGQVIVFLETGMLLGNDSIHTKASQGERCNGELFPLGEFKPFRLLVGNGVFLIVGFVRAFSDIYQVAVPVFARLDVLE